MDHSFLKKLFLNGVRYRAMKILGTAPALEAISLEITHRCFCRCRMCNIWRDHGAGDLDLHYWTDLLASRELCDLRELDITGGEPFLRSDLRNLLNWICQAHADHFPKLQTVAITTNGILTFRILDTVKQVVRRFDDKGIDLVLACGLDAIGPLHDQIRGYKGAWDKLSTTITGLQALRREHHNLVLGVKTTIIPANVNALRAIVDFARDKDLFTIISPCIITANRFGNLGLAADLAFAESEKLSLREFYRSLDFAWVGHRNAMLKYLETGRMIKPCSAGFNTVFVRHNGDVYPCPVIPTSLGNIKHDRLATLVKGATATRFRRRLGHHKECHTCTEPGMERLAWPFEGFTCLRWMNKLGEAEFDALAKHMGLYKYL